MTDRRNKLNGSLAPHFVQLISKRNTDTKIHHFFQYEKNNQIEPSKLKALGIMNVVNDRTTKCSDKKRKQNEIHFVTSLIASVRWLSVEGVLLDALKRDEHVNWKTMPERIQRTPFLENSPKNVSTPKEWQNAKTKSNQFKCH